MIFFYYYKGAAKYKDKKIPKSVTLLGIFSFYLDPLLLVASYA
jgi:hypothetical protein